MIGDKIEIKPKYLKIANQILEQIYKKQNLQNGTKIIIGIAGESGSGKSVTGYCLQYLLQQHNVKSIILQQDDYFNLPPLSNHQHRLENINNVGMQEVNLQLMQENINDYLDNRKSIIKPLVDYKQNLITNQNIDLTDCKVLIVEGAYVLNLKKLNYKIFMNRSYLETAQNRKDRGREEQSEFLEQVLAIEHQLIKNQSTLADMIVLKNYSLQIIL